MTLLTIVSVVKDDPRGLESTLRSITEQGAEDIEVIVLDGSADRTSVEMVAAQHPAARVVWSPPEGIYPAMNSGLRETSGQYVYFLNAGDTLASGEVLPEIVTRLASEQPVWAFGKVAFLTVSGDPMPEPEWSYDVERSHLFARGRFPAHQGVIMATERLRGIGGFDTAYTVAADYAAILTFATISDPLSLDIVMARFQQGGLSTKKWHLAQQEFHRARRSAFRPHGRAAVAEWLRTQEGIVKMAAYRALWAEGRPAHRAVAALRPK